MGLCKADRQTAEGYSLRFFDSKKGEKMRAKKIILTVLLVVAFLSLQTSSVVGIGDEKTSQPSIQPVNLYQTGAGCDPEEMGKKIQNSAATLSNTICDTSDIVSNDATGVFSVKEKDFFERQCERAKGWVNAPGRDSTFTSVGKNNKDSCYVVEIEGDGIGDDDGICTQNERIKGGCSEAINDGVGNDDGVCDVTKESSNGKGKKVKSWETCEEVCIIPEDEIQTDCSTLESMDGFLQDANTELSELNNGISLKAQVLSQQQELYTEIVAATDPTDQCTNVLYVDITSSVGGLYGNYSGTERVSDYNDFIISNIENETAAGAANICTDLAGQDWGGFNVLAVCAPVHALQAVYSGVLSSMELMDDTITGTRLDNAAECIKQMDAKLNNIEEKLDEIIRLLNTPTGRRDNFPTK